jgi:hypothetical protein
MTDTPNLRAIVDRLNDGEWWQTVVCGSNPTAFSNELTHVAREAASAITALQARVVELEEGLDDAGQVINYAASVLWIGRPNGVQQRPARVDEALRRFRKARSLSSRER